MRLQDRVAIVTGAAMGIGFGIAKVLLSEGASVLVVDIDDLAGERAVAELTPVALAAGGGRVAYEHCDVSDEAQVVTAVAAVVSRFGGLDILVNNAGVGVYKGAREATVADFDRALAINLRGTFLFAHHCIPALTARGRGVIVNISSVHSAGAVNGVLPYATSKGGVTQLSRNLAIDLGPQIRVNSVAPGWIDSHNVQSIFAGYPDPDARRREVAERQVLKRIGTPEDVGHAVAFLASDEASFITGTQLYVDGGMTAQLETW